MLSDFSFSNSDEVPAYRDSCCVSEFADAKFRLAATSRTSETTATRVAGSSARWSICASPRASW